MSDHWLEKRGINAVRLPFTVVSVLSAYLPGPEASAGVSMETGISNPIGKNLDKINATHLDSATLFTSPLSYLDFNQH